MTEQNNSPAAPPAVSPSMSAPLSEPVSPPVSPAVSPPVCDTAESFAVMPPAAASPTSDADLKAQSDARKAAAAQTVLDEKMAMAWAHTARFFTTASEISQLLVNELPEIAFVGRSNAGKSTAINTLTDHKRLAFASKTPGRTQHINLFEIGPKHEADAYFADLPGYGYAAVARGAKQRWQKVMADYLEVRRSLAGVVLMLDSRLGFTDLDKQLLAFVAPRLANGSVRLLVLLTKSDKLNRRDADAALRKAEQVLAGMATEESDISISLFSALKKKGVSEAALTLHGWVHQGRK